jgi:hypothetical protein
MPKSINRKKIIIDYLVKLWVIFLAMSILSMGPGGCLGLKPSSTAAVRAIPEEIAITRALLKKPVQFRGTGYAPEEYIMVDLMIPNGVKIKAISEGEDSVRLTHATSDENGNFKATMGAKATLSWFFQVGWTSDFNPIFEEATPLPPGKYEIRATGKQSNVFGMTTLTVVAPPIRSELTGNLSLN